MFQRGVLVTVLAPALALVRQRAGTGVGQVPVQVRAAAVTRMCVATQWP